MDYDRNDLYLFSTHGAVRGSTGDTHVPCLRKKKKKITGALRIRYLSEYYKLDLHVKMYYTVCPRVKKFRNSNSLFRNKVNVDDQDNLKKDKYRIN